MLVKKIKILPTLSSKGRVFFLINDLVFVVEKSNFITIANALKNPIVQ